MSSSPPQAAYNGSDNDAKLHVTNDNTSHTYGIDRFLADQQQYNPVFGKIQSAAEAVAAAKVRMTAELHVFERQFDSTSKLPNN
ncbi:hypothetical protein J3E69DRAFT_381343 [Trichoderma sp. SZMC 28015]